MKCLACDKILTDFEASIKYANNAEFLDLCGICRSSLAIELDTTEDYDLYDPDVDILEYDTTTENEDRPSIFTDDE